MVSHSELSQQSAVQLVRAGSSKEERHAASACLSSSTAGRISIPDFVPCSVQRRARTVESAADPELPECSSARYRYEPCQANDHLRMPARGGVPARLPRESTPGPEEQHPARARHARAACCTRLSLRPTARGELTPPPE